MVFLLVLFWQRIAFASRLRLLQIGLINFACNCDNFVRPRNVRAPRNQDIRQVRCEFFRGVCSNGHRISHKSRQSCTLVGRMRPHICFPVGTQRSDLQWLQM